MKLCVQFHTPKKPFFSLQIKILNSRSARVWALKNVPTLIRETLLHQAFKRLPEDMVKFWSILYSPHFYHISIPANLEEQSRKTIIQYLPMGLGNKNQIIPTLIFKTYGITSLEAESKFLQHCPFLTIFAHRKGSDDNLLAVLGMNCPVLQVSYVYIKCYK